MMGEGSFSIALGSLRSVSILLVAVVAGLASPRVFAANLYWTDTFEDRIWMSDADGNNARVLLDLPTTSRPRDIVFDPTSNRIYWVNEGGDSIPGTGSIQRANLDGSGITTILSGLNEPFGLALDIAAGQVYFTEMPGPNNLQRIRRANLDGTGLQLLRAAAGPIDIELDLQHGKMYWAEYLKSSSSRIKRSNLDGSGAEDLVSTVVGPQGIALDVEGGKIYWTDSETYKVQRSNLDGTDIEDLWSTPFITRAADVTLDVAANTMFWTDYHYDRIMRAKLDGTNAVQLLRTDWDENPGPYGIVFVPEPHGLAAVALVAMLLGSRQRRADHRAV